MLRRSHPLSHFLIFLTIFPAFAQQAKAQATSAPVSAPAVQDESKTAVSDEAQTAALAKAAQNPIANLISFPLQNNTSFGIGQYNRTQNVLNIQPVIPLHLTKDWNLITRTILPVIWQPNDQTTQGWFG